MPGDDPQQGVVIPPSLNNRRRVPPYGQHRVPRIPLGASVIIRRLHNKIRKYRAPDEEQSGEWRKMGDKRRFTAVQIPDRGETHPREN